MNNTDYLGLYKTHLNGFKQLSGYQFVALCPFHEDTEQSFSGEHQFGQYNCKACGVTGNAVTFAKAKNLPNPKQYATFKSNGSTTTTKIYPDWDSIPSLDIEVDLDMEKYKTNLRNNIDKYPKIWDKELIDELGIGLNDDNWMFGYYDASGNLMGIKTHKKATTKGVKCHWYPQNKIGSYSRDNALYICEGEKDAITLISLGFQAISGSAGAMSIPKDKDGNYDVKWLKEFKEIYIVYDNDKGGREGAKKLGEIICK